MINKLQVQLVNFPEKDWPKLPGRVMVPFIGPASHGLWWLGKDGDYTRGSAVTMSEFPDVRRQTVKKKPKCPECHKLGVEMVETSASWICRRCNYQVEKEVKGWAIKSVH